MISAVSATENIADDKISSDVIDNSITTTTDDAGEKTSTDTGTVLTQTDTKTLSNNNDESIIKKDNGETSFKALNKTIKATDSEIELDNDYIHDESSDSEFRDGITISKSITINGKNKLLMQSVKPEYKFGRINFLPQRSFFFLYIH